MPLAMLKAIVFVANALLVLLVIEMAYVAGREDAITDHDGPSFEPEMARARLVAAVLVPLVVVFVFSL